MLSKLLAVSLVLASASTCDQAKFEKPQPDETKDLLVVPKKLHGEYRSQTDSSRLYITGKSIIEQTQLADTVHKNELDSAERVQLKRDTTFREDNVIGDVRILGDSISVRFIVLDTLSLSDSTIKLRKYKGNYFLSRRSGESWYVSKIEIHHGQLTFSSTSSGDIEPLQKISGTSDSTIVFNPTKKQFRGFLKQGGFRKVEVYKRQ